METEILNNELVTVITKEGLNPEQDNSLIVSFEPFFEKANEWKLKAESINITDASQKKSVELKSKLRKNLQDSQTRKK